MRGVSRVAYVVVFVVFVVWVASPLANAASHQARIGVQIHIPAVQELTVVEPVTISLPAPDGPADDPLLFEHVGQVVVASNTHWALTVESGTSVGAALLVKPSNDPLADWRNIDGRSTVYAGVPGSHALSWDILVDPSYVEGLGGADRSLDLMFTLTPF